MVCPNSSHIGVGGNDCQELNSTFVLWRREVEFPSSGPRALDERLCRDYYRSTRGRRARLPESADSHPFLPLPSPTLLPSVSSPVPPPSPPTSTVVSGPTARLAARRGAVGPRPARRVDGGGCRPPPAARSIRQRCRASSTSSSKAASPTSRRGTHSQVWRSQRVAVIGSPAVSQPGQPVTGTGPRLTSLTLTAPHTEMLGDREGG